MILTIRLFRLVLIFTVFIFTSLATFILVEKIREDRELSQFCRERTQLPVKVCKQKLMGLRYEKDESREETKKERKKSGGKK